MKNGTDRFWKRVNKNGPVSSERPDLGPCWIWQGGASKYGYGQMYLDGKVRYTHRISYEIANGQIPQGLHIDHLCKVHRCCNPSHIEAVLPGTNTLRGNGQSGRNLRKTHCIYGHEFTPENTRYYPSKPNARHCLTCIQRRHRENYKYERKRPPEIRRPLDTGAVRARQ